ncbi:MAG: hypothetical protein ACE15D_04205 [Candidatus Eisenbacteria bacterium]
MAFGWDSNLLSSSTAETRAFDTGGGDSFFAVDRLEDARARAGFWGRWEVPSFYKSLRIEGSYERFEALHESIVGSGVYAIGLRQKLPDGSRIDLSAAYCPQIYLRHRTNKEALPGEPQFRPEASRQMELEIAHSRPFAGTRLEASIDYETERRIRWFRERDEETWTAGLNVEVPLVSSIDLIGAGFVGGSRTVAPNREPGLDRSHRQAITGLRLSAEPGLPAGPWEMQAGTRWKFRDYTTDDPTDSSRYHRNDRIVSWDVRIGRPMGAFVPFVSYEGSLRRVHLPSGAQSSNEEGEYDDTLISLGVQWEFSR